MENIKKKNFERHQQYCVRITRITARRETHLEKNTSKIKPNIWEENIKQLEASRVEIETESEVATILMQSNNQDNHYPNRATIAD